MLIKIIKMLVNWMNKTNKPELQIEWINSFLGHYEPNESNRVDVKSSRNLNATNPSFNHFTSKH
jgi:hypothetical protein